MKIFLYEYATAGGAWGQFHDPHLVGELLVEGRAMHDALALDLRAGGHEVLSLTPGANLEQVFYHLAISADAVILLAPEIGGILLQLAEQVEAWQCRLLSSGSGFIKIASDKHATAERLREGNVQAPPGLIVEAGSSGDQVHVPWLGPSICKPIDGAGSWGVQQLSALDGQLPFRARVEPLCPGLAVSVAVLCGPLDQVPLAPCRQILGGDTGFCYQGGALPLPATLAERAQTLALKAVAAMPPTMGYIGTDLVLGQNEDGSADYVIEVNPRLTTSYVGLRQAYCENLAAAWLDVAAAQAPRLSFINQALEFLADGTVRRLSTAKAPDTHSRH